MGVGLLKWDPFNAFKNVYSTCLLIFSVVIVMGLIGTSQTGLSSQTSPAVAYIVCWAALIWLTSVEGTQGSFVGLAPINPEIYKDTHPISYMCNKVTTMGDNLDRYLMGRQFMVCCIVFIINMSAGPAGDVELWGLPEGVKTAFFGVGLAMIFFTAMIGQLNSQVNASVCMLDYCNNYFSVFTMWVAMAIEFTGLLHASYLIAMLVNKLAGAESNSKEEPPTGGAAVFYWLRCLVSLAILSFCGVVTVNALFTGQTTIWEGIPPILSFIIFLILMSIVGMLEGMQIAFFACAKLRAEERGSSRFAKLTANLLFKGDGNNLPGFMIGRQLTVVSCMFFVARVTSVKMKEGSGNMFGVSDGTQKLFDSGLLGALFLTIVGSITWQLVAAAFPIAFMSNPLTYILLRIALAIEFTGVCNGAWVLAAIHAKLAGFQRDEVYIGTAEERAAKNMGDDYDKLQVGPGHMIKLPAYVEHAPKSLIELMESDKAVAEFVHKLSQHSQVEDVAENA
mmetsp:Transcript_56109/g.67329  ORF Transcript_56109/g.67329 Transcript_56109/m.67329 type:complete len:507 (+) Transcript_56109:51-1571(+)